MGKKFDELNNVGDCSNPVKKYLKSRDFYEDTMHPRFLNGYDYDKLTIGKPCLRHDSTINNDCTLRIFINDTDIYYEVETSYSSYQSSYRYDPKDYPDVKNIDELLDKILLSVLS